MKQEKTTYIYSDVRFGEESKYSKIALEADKLYHYMYQHGEVIQVMEFLDKNLDSKENGFIEIGSALGGSFHCWANIIKGGKKISVHIDLANPFEITLSEGGSISASSGDEKEGISIRFVGEYNFEIEDLETGETKDSDDGTEAEYIFTKNQDSSENYYLSIEEWNDDALPRLFKNIEKALY